MLFDRQRVLLELLDALNEPVGSTDFQKLLFLYTREGEPTPSYDFVPYRFGCFSFTSYADKRRLVEKVDYISHPGKKVCRDNEFYGGGPKWIVTPKCIFDFDPDTLEARLAMLFPGVTIDDVKANTGFEVKTAKKVETVQPPTKDELEALRTEVDKTGVLRH